MTDTIVVDPSSTAALIIQTLRQAGVMIGGGTAIAGFVSHRDLTGFLAYVRSDSIIPVVGALTAFAAWGWSLWRTWDNKRKLVIAANAAPDSVAVVAVRP